MEQRLRPRRSLYHLSHDRLRCCATVWPKLVLFGMNLRILNIQFGTLDLGLQRVQVVEILGAELQSHLLGEREIAGGADVPIRGSPGP